MAMMYNIGIDELYTIFANDTILRILYENTSHNNELSEILFALKFYFLDSPFLKFFKKENPKWNFLNSWIYNTQN